MANRMVALVGPGVGPQICTKRLKNLKARVCGLADGSMEIVAFLADGTKTTVTFVVNGLLEIPDAIAVQASHSGPSKRLICEIWGD
jgi:hypothetical protein